MLNRRLRLGDRRRVLPEPDLLYVSTHVGHPEAMDYASRVPAPPLDMFIDDIYVMSGEPDHRRLNVPPMPSAHLFINLADPVMLFDSSPSVPPVNGH